MLFATNLVNPIYHLALASIILANYSASFYGQYAVQYSVIMVMSAIIQKSKWQYIQQCLSLSPKPAEMLVVILDNIFWALKIFPLFIVVLIILSAVDTQIFGLRPFEIILFISVSCFLFNGLAIGYLRQSEKYVFYLLFLTLLSTLKIIGVVLGWHSNFGSIINFTCVIDLIGWGIVVLFSLFMIIRKPNYPLTADLEGNLETEHLSSQQLGLFWTQLVSLPMQHLDKVGLAFLIPPNQVAIYAIVQKITLVFSLIVEPFYVLKLRQLSVALVSSSPAVHFKNLIRTWIISVFLQLPIILALTFVPVVWFERILGPYINPSEYLFFYICFSLFSSAYFLNVLGVTYLRGETFFKNNLYSTILYVIITLPLAALVGVNGALIGLCFHYAFLYAARYISLRHEGVI